MLVTVAGQTLLNMERPWAVVTANKLAAVLANVAVVSVFNLLGHL